MCLHNFYYEYAMKIKYIESKRVTEWMERVFERDKSNWVRVSEITEERKRVKVSESVNEPRK